MQKEFSTSAILGEYCIIESTLNDGMAYRWFLGYGLTEKIPHFSTFGKNYVRRFQNTDLFEKIFYHILQQAIDHGLVDAETVFWGCEKIE